MSELNEWWRSQYIKSVGIMEVEGGSRFKHFVSDYPKRSSVISNPFPKTSIIRMSNFLELKIKYSLARSGYYCTAMTITLDDKSSIFAYAYWNCEKLIQFPNFICISPTFTSRDGEYRKNFISWDTFISKYESIISSLTPLFEEAVLDMMTSGLIILTINIFSANSEVGEQINKQVDNNRLLILAFTTALINDLWDSVNNGLMQHTNKMYLYILTEIAKIYPNLVVTKKYKNFDSVETLRRIQCGQKLVPMYNRDVMQLHDYNLSSWRELAISQLVSDLVLNFISPSFSTYNQWTYIENTNASIFENTAMREKYDYSKKAELSLISLREARNIIDSPEQNYRTEELSAHMYESVEYAQSHLIVSPITLVHTIEHVGVTVQSVSGLVDHAYDASEQICALFSNHDTASCIIFELIYAAHCLHTKIGVIHGDLHGNNMTLYSWGDYSRDKSTYKDPVIAYVVGSRGEADTYIFPATGTTACIIDYSRAILGPTFRKHLEDGHSPQYAINFYRDQVNRVMRSLHRYAPAYVEKNQSKIKSLVISDFESVFPILCIIDFIAIGVSFGEVITTSPKLKIDPKFHTFVKKLEDLGREMLIVGLNDLVESSDVKMKQSVFPGIRIIELLFQEWHFPTWAAREPKRVRSAQLVDAFLFSNEMKYSGSDYAKFPPWGRLDEIEKHLGEYKLVNLFSNLDVFLESLHTDIHFDVISEKIRAQQAKLDHNPGLPGSSWIE